jgi:hypothetical protein
MRDMPLRTRPGDGGSASASRVPSVARRPLLSIAKGTVLPSALKDSDNSSGLTPPDMGVGADLTHVVQMVNVVGRIWTNGVAGSAFELDAFFLTPGDFVSDPWVLFDQESGRWFAGIFDVTRGGENYAVSQTGNPTGSWFIYLATTGNCPDQGKGGVDTNVVALGYNMFSGIGCTGGFLGAGVQVLNKAEMVAGLTTHLCTRNPDPTRFSLVPAQALSNGQTKEFFAANAANNTSKKLHRLTSVGVPNAGGCPTFTNLADITLARTYPAPPPATQPGTGTKLASGDQRMQHVVWKDGVGLLMSWTEGCKPAGDTATRDCARVVVTTDAGAVSMDKDLSKKNQYYVYPAATLNSANDVVVAFGVTSGTIFPQLDAAAATVGGAFTAPVVLKTGTKANKTGRYGDYFAVALDPSGTANKNVWAAGEIGGPVATDWQTAVVEVNVTP